MDEEVKRTGNLITVRLQGVSATRTYGSNSDAKKAERRLQASKAARERFFRPVRNGERA